MIKLEKVPHLIKYMGSKREILKYISTSISDLSADSEWICDLFSGTSVVAGSLRNEYNIHANDIQEYSSIFSNTYFSNLKKAISVEKLDEIYNKSFFLVSEFETKYPDLKFDYSNINVFSELKKIEEEQQSLISKSFDIGFNLFSRYYSGTYWSYDQCVWIDSIRAVAEDYRGLPEYYAILSSLIFAMSYASQSTGHFAQYRAVTERNMSDIMIYRNKKIWPLFSKKFIELLNMLDSNIKKEQKVTSLDYVDCLRIVEKNSIIYADPPYSAVHYSRFYHAIETLVRYDHPTIKHKGRYRDDRHQSPFDKKTEVEKAFALLFKGVKNRKSHLILSYSDNGMISLENILSIGKTVFGKEYESDVKSKEYMHSKMGRADIHQMGVNELLISYKRK